MILDTSVIVAIANEEVGHEALLLKLQEAETVGVGAPTLVESSIVLGSRFGERAGTWLSELIKRASIVVVPFEERHWERAGNAWLQYGRGRHPASLNFGDCLAYATAKEAERPLLYLGDDFALTDVERA